MQLLSIFFFNDTATTEIYTLSLHDALPILVLCPACYADSLRADARATWRCNYCGPQGGARRGGHTADRKSTRLNSSHLVNSYAVFFFEKKKTIHSINTA